MKIIKIQHILILAAVILSGCEKSGVDNVSARPIVFTAAVGTPSTKVISTEITSETLTSIAFGTYAWKTDNQWANVADANKLADPYMTNVKTTYSDEQWHPGSYMWPTAATQYLNFFCYAPYKVSSPMTYNVTDGICFQDYEVCGEDLLYSTGSTGALDCTSSSGATISFNHALCKLIFKVKTDGVPSNLSNITSRSVTIDSLKICNLANKGNFKQNPTPKWSDQSGNVSYQIFKDKSLTTDQADSCLVLPDTMTTRKQFIEIAYKGTVTYTGSIIKSFSSKDTLYLKSVATQEWEAGKAITLNITVSAFADANFEASIADWESHSASGTLGGGSK